METNEEVYSARLRRLESGINDVPTLQTPLTEYDIRIPPVSYLRATSASIATHLTRVVITFISPIDPNVARLEVWLSRNASGSTTPVLVASVGNSPASFNITSDTSGHAVALIRTVLKNGLTTPLTAAPSVTFQVF